jgi:hypothetical protein
MAFDSLDVIVRNAKMIMLPVSEVHPENFPVAGFSLCETVRIVPNL